MIPLTYLTLIKIYLLVWFWVSFEPLQDKIDLYFETKDGFIWENLYQLIQCQKCLSFWITLIITFDPFMAILMSMIADIHKKITK